MITVSVGLLVDICRTGDINFRFSGRSSAEEGVAAHRKIQQSRPEGYVPEMPLASVIQVEGLEIEVKGRADGYLPGDIAVLDEIKSVRVNPEEIPEDVLRGFWLQAELYGYMLAQQEGLDQLNLRLCFYHLDNRQEMQLEERRTQSELKAVFESSVRRYAKLIVEDGKWVEERRERVRATGFPYGEFRQGQRDMAVAVFRNIEAGEQLVLEAPTGTGKTMATLYPAVQALAPGVGRRLFYLSAKTSGQLQAETALTHMAEVGARVRSVTLTAKDKICFSPGEPCDPDRCSYARGYYDRIGNALDSMLDAQDRFGRSDIEAFASEHHVCPFELGLDLSRRCDVIVSDYNYVFDPVVYLRRFFEGGEVDSVVLIDEAHNLVDRARDMYSAEVSKVPFLQLAKAVKPHAPLVHRAANRVNRAFLEHRKSCTDVLEQHGFSTLYELPEKLIGSLQQFCTAAEAELRSEDSAEWRETLLEVYFDALRFCRTAEEFNQAYVVISRSAPKRDLQVQLYCVNPAEKLAQTYGRLTSVVAFSATLSPPRYFNAMMGIAEAANRYRVASPFDPNHLHVNLAGFIDTSYRGRSASLPQLVELVQGILDLKQGNYLVYCPSYDYLHRLVELFEASAPNTNIAVQHRHMSDEDRESFLDAFDTGPVCGFAVMGGTFAEGIDLTGRRLIGAIVVGVGLPQIGIERDLIKDHFADDGFAYAYQFPGLIKVLQTAGRVIRTSSDEGVVCLVDQRYHQQRYTEHLPEHWKPYRSRNIAELQQQVGDFWADRTTSSGYS